jgi:hypothetical protein
MKKFETSFLKVSDRDKKLLMVLFSVLILAAAYFYGFQNIVAQTDTYQSETRVLKKKQSELIEKSQNKDKYISDTANYNGLFKTITSQYSNATTQVSSIDFINKVESVTGAWIKSISFSDPSAIYTFGNVVSSNPSLSGSKAYATDMTGYDTTLTLSYEADYLQWKNLIAFINNYYSKNTIDNISMTYNNATGKVSGTMTVSLYAITGNDRSYTDPEFNVNTGTDNIFTTK